MIVRNEQLLDSFRAKGRCENCGIIGPVEPHHVFTKGIGGSGQVDIPENLIGLCRLCHSRFHNGRIPRGQFITIIARRQRRTPDEVEAVVTRVRNKEKPKMVLTVHRVAEKFPRPSPERYAEMKASIEKYGVLEPVKVWNLCIMDGLTRHTICKELGIDCPMEHWDCDEADAIERAKAYNTARRDLTESQRVMAVVECNKLSAETLKARQLSGLKHGKNTEAFSVVSRDTTEKNAGNSPVSQKQENGRTRKKVAEQANVSEETAQRAIKVSSHGTEEVKRAVTDGKVTVKDAAKVVALPAEKQNAALAKVESGEAKTLTAAAMASPDFCEGEPEDEQEITVEQVMKEKNHAIESFCRKLMKLAEECPDDEWLRDLNRRNGALQKFKDGCQTLRSAKCTHVCPACKGDLCHLCLKTGRVPSLTYQQIT